AKYCGANSANIPTKKAGTTTTAVAHGTTSRQALLEWRKYPSTANRANPLDAGVASIAPNVVVAGLLRRPTREYIRHDRPWARIAHRQGARRVTPRVGRLYRLDTRHA